MAFIKMFSFFCFALLCLLGAEDEAIEIEKSIQEGEFDMDYDVEAAHQEPLSNSAYVSIAKDGRIALTDGDQDVTLTPEEAYNLLDVLYRHVDTLRQREDTVPLEMPEWAQEEQEA